MADSSETARAIFIRTATSSGQHGWRRKEALRRLPSRFGCGLPRGECNGVFCFFVLQVCHEAIDVCLEHSHGTSSDGWMSLSLKYIINFVIEQLYTIFIPSSVEHWSSMDGGHESNPRGYAKWQKLGLSLARIGRVYSWKCAAALASPWVRIGPGTEGKPNGGQRRTLTGSGWTMEVGKGT